MSPYARDQPDPGEGRAVRVTDDALLRRLAGVFAESGWAPTVSGDDLLSIAETVDQGVEQFLPRHDRNITAAVLDLSWPSA